MSMTNALGISGRYPPTIQQRGIIAMLTNNSHAKPSNFDLMIAFLVSPRIDLRRLERSFAKLTARHDSLRQSIERQGDDWFVNVWNRHKTGLVVEDHGDIDDSEFDALLKHHSSVRIDLLRDDLFQAVVLRCGRRGDVLFIRCHHAIVDGHSMIVLIEDWLRLLIGIPLPGRGVTHEEYLSEHSNVSLRQEIKNQGYWNDLLLPALPKPGLGAFGTYGERPRIVYRTDTARSFKCSLTSVEFKRLPAAFNARSQTPFSIVFAAFADTLIELSGLPGVYVSTNVDRTSNKLRNYVGCAIVWPPVRCDAANGMSLPEYASTLALQLKQSLAHLPGKAETHESDFDLAVHKSGGVIRHFACALGFASARVKKSPFSFGFMAASETPQKIGPLTITRLGIATAAHNFFGIRLVINAYASRTDFLINYHNHFYTEKEMEKLLIGMQERLRTRLV